jgi:hypothetical protein
MPTLNSSTARQLNNLIEFRQTVYEQILIGARDAQFELMDALLLSDHPRCFAEVSLSPAFRRRWSSAYGAIEEGSQDQQQLSRCFLGQVPRQGVQVFPLDTTVWPHPRARTLSGLVYAPSPTKALKHHSIVQGHLYSLLTWTPSRGQSWSPTLFSQRLEPDQKAIEVGAAQVRQLCQARPDPTQQGLDVIVTDGHYGNHHFFRRVQGLTCAILSRLRCDRVLYLAPGPYRGWGRPAVHGARFAFKAPDTWPEPVEQVEFSHERWGQVRLRRWCNLHAKQDAQTRFDVILAEVHLEQLKPPDPLWLGYLPGHRDYPLREVWSWFDFRWPIEPSIRFRKQYLAWTLPYFQTSEACDRWTHLVEIAYWQLFLARQLGSDQPLPWQKAQARLTPGRVLRSIGAIFSQIGTPAQPPKTRGKSPGWPRGRTRQRPERYKPTKRTKKKVKTA